MKYPYFNNIRRTSLPVFLLLAIAIGCGTSHRPVPVSGRITYEGAPLKNASILFQPETGNVPGSADISDEDGRYSLTLATAGPDVEGAVVGRHRVVIQAVFQSKLPGKESEYRTTFEVPPKGTDSADFDLPLK